MGVGSFRVFPWIPWPYYPSSPIEKALGSAQKQLPAVSSPAQKLSSSPAFRELFIESGCLYITTGHNAGGQDRFILATGS